MVCLRSTLVRVASSLGVSIGGLWSDTCPALTLMQHRTTFASEAIIYTFAVTLLLGPSIAETLRASVPRSPKCPGRKALKQCCPASSIASSSLKVLHSKMITTIELRPSQGLMSREH